MNASIPPWVFAILAAIVVAGLVQRRTRLRSPLSMTVIAAGMGALSLSGVASVFGSGAPTMGTWALGLAAGAGLAWAAGIGRGLVPVAGGRQVRVPGSWLPLGLMLGIFGVRFALGMAAGLQALPAAGSAAGLVATLLLGGFSGAFLARAAAVWRVALAADRAPARLSGAA